MVSLHLQQSACINQEQVRNGCAHGGERWCQKAEMQIEWKSTLNTDILKKRLLRYRGVKKIKVHLVLPLSPLIWFIISSSVRIWWCIAPIFALQDRQTEPDSRCMTASVVCDVERDLKHNIEIQSLKVTCYWMCQRLNWLSNRKIKYWYNKTLCNFNLQLW